VTFGQVVLFQLVLSIFTIALASLEGSTNAGYHREFLGLQVFVSWEGLGWVVRKLFIQKDLLEMK